jgi:hypothetical protein
MDFGNLQRRLVEELRWRVNNGEVTERGLARYVGISQPHIHKVLKGSKILSIKYCDRILSALDLSVFDLAEDFDAEQWLRHKRTGRPETVTLSVLAGLIGPGEPWPEWIAGRAAFAISPADIQGFDHPVAAQTAADARMVGTIAARDWVVLDQGIGGRRRPTPEALYLVRHADAGLIRHVAFAANKAYLIAENVRRNPAGWEEIGITELELPSLVRARVHRIVPADQWPSSAPGVQAARVPATSL